MAGKVNSLDTTDLLLDGAGQSRAGDGRGARGGVQSSDEGASLDGVLGQLTGGGPQGGRETSGRHGEGCSEWRLGEDVGKRAGEEGRKEERCGADRASLKEAYTGAPTTSQVPSQTQSSDLLDSPNGVGPIFFTSAPSSLALSPLGLAPSTVQDGYRPCVAATVGPGFPAVGGPKRSQRTPVWGTGGATALACLACLAAIHREESSPSQGEGKDNSCQLRALTGRVSPFQSQSSLGMQRSGPDTAKKTQYSRFKNWEMHC